MVGDAVSWHSLQKVGPQGRVQCQVGVAKFLLLSSHGVSNCIVSNQKIYCTRNCIATPLVGVQPTGLTSREPYHHRSDSQDTGGKYHDVPAPRVERSMTSAARLPAAFRRICVSLEMAPFQQGTASGCISAAMVLESPKSPIFT